MGARPGIVSARGGHRLRLTPPTYLPVIVSYIVEDWTRIQTTGMRKVTPASPLVKPRCRRPRLQLAAIAATAGPASCHGSTGRV